MGIFSGFFKKNNVNATPGASVGGDKVAEAAERPQSNWDILREDTGRPEMSFDDLAEQVRFRGAVPTEAVAASGVTPNNVAGGGITGSTADAVSPDEVANSVNTAESESIAPELAAFRNFFKTDMRIKREMLEAAPSAADGYSADSGMKYVDTAYRTFRDFKHDFLGVARDFGFGNHVMKSTEDFFRRGEAGFAISDFGERSLQKLYRQEFSDMRPEFVEDVKDTFVGYTGFGNLSGVIQKAQTVNELLHAYHSCIMNSEGILQAVPAIAEKENDYHYRITLRGEDGGLGRQVYDAIPDDLDVGYTDIVSVDGHVMMMVRDRGHALTISGEADAQDPEKIWVDYNIPKLCNEEMIKKLPGLAGYTQNGARGVFATTREGFGAAVADFIGKVPMDKDMPGMERYYGGGAVEVQE